jgi:chorismate lyase/3-hydroxybenzoate synthase
LIAEQLDGRHPVRFWNHIPRINAPADNGRDRYMVFNAGRFDAFSTWFDGIHSLPQRVPTASGVGHAGNDLVIHCLACDELGIPVDNPRQVPPCHYSPRYGPLPPCFTRATKIANLLLVGGTASVRGEDSIHLGNLAKQTHETFLNLATLVAAAQGKKTDKNWQEYLLPYRDLRVYLPRLEHADFVTDRIRRAFPRLRRLETLHADLCRPELLVEIEGLAELK